MPEPLRRQSEAIATSSPPFVPATQTTLSVTAILVLSAFLLITGASPAHGQSTVTVTTTNDSGSGSLRAALDSTNDGSGTPPDTIKFDIAGSASPSSPHVIPVQSELPYLQDPVVIDGTTEPDYNSSTVSNPKPVVELDGSSAGDIASGLSFDSDGNTIRGLAIVNFGFIGLRALSGANGQTVLGCHIGVRADGATAAGNGDFGISIDGDGQIGGTGPDAGNIIGSNGSSGVNLLLGASATVQGNFIGTNPSGDDLGNEAAGVSVTDSSNTIGGPASGEGNVIAYNNGAGVVVSALAGDYMIQNAIRGNDIFANEGLGIDIADLGRSFNDASTPGYEDEDNEDNRLQNYPVLQSASYDANANEITVTYKVPSQPGLIFDGASTYPIAVDFFRADTTTVDAEGEAYLGSDTYTASNFNSGPLKTITFTPGAPVSTSDKLVATATDSSGNTSEFSSASSTLPVELASFEATQTGTQTVRLAWKTASETENAGFAVQHRRGEAGAWAKLGFVESKAAGGTATEAHSYRFAAGDLSGGTHQFRLKQVDLDGTTSVHGPVTVALRMQEALRLTPPAPNPVSGEATLRFAVREGTETTLRLYNTLGQRVRTIYRGTPPAGEQQTTRLSTSGLASGVYILRLRAGAHTRTQRVTVLH